MMMFDIPVCVFDMVDFGRLRIVCARRGVVFGPCLLSKTGTRMRVLIHDETDQVPFCGGWNFRRLQGFRGSGRLLTMRLTGR